MSRKIKLLLAIGILLALTGGAYIYGVQYFGTHYLPGSTVNGYNCSYMTIDEAELLMNREAQAFVLAVETVGGGREANTAEDVGYVLEKLPPVIAELRRLSPFGPEDRPKTFN